MSSTVIRRSIEQLEERKVAIFETLGMTEDTFKALTTGDAPLTDEQWSAMQELEEIEYLLGNGPRAVC